MPLLSSRNGFIPRNPAEERAGRAQTKVRAGGIITKTLQLDWQTPPEILLPVRRLMGGRILLDPATAPNNPTKAKIFFTPKDDGLTREWKYPWFCNPPYGRQMKLWLAKMALVGKTVPGTCLIPANRFETIYMQEALRTISAICFVRKRISFINAKTKDRVSGNPFASMFLFWGYSAEEIGPIFSSTGTTLRVDVTGGPRTVRVRRGFLS